MNQGEAAKKLGISRDRISFLKNGGVPNTRDIEAIIMNTPYSYEDIMVCGAWHCIEAGLNVVDGRKK